MYRYKIIIEYDGTDLHGFQIQKKHNTVQKLVQSNISKILKAEHSNTTGDQGVILNDNFEIGCAKDSIKVLEIQREGKKVQKIKEFLLGTQIKKGTNLNNA